MRMFAALALGVFVLFSGAALAQTFDGRVSYRPANLKVETGMPPQVLSEDQQLGLQLAISNNRALILALRARGLGPRNIVAMRTDGELVTVWVE